MAIHAGVLVVTVAIPGIVDLTVATSRVVVFRRWPMRLVIRPRRMSIGSVCTIVVPITSGAVITVAAIRRWRRSAPILERNEPQAH